MLAKDVEIFPDDTSLFSVVDDIDIIGRQEWAYQWKMSFNFDRTKTAHKFKFSRKTKNVIYPNIYFKTCQLLKEHLKSTFNSHLNEKNR